MILFPGKDLLGSTFKLLNQKKKKNEYVLKTSSFTKTL